MSALPSADSKMPLSRSARTVVAVATCLVALVAATRAPGSPQQQAPGVEAGWTSLGRGDTKTAAAIASAILGAAGTGDGAGDGADVARIDSARLLQAACLYTQGDTRAALAAIDPIEDPVAVATTIDSANLPAGFGLWVAAVARGTLTSDARTQPRVRLSELNPEREVREVASHFSMEVEIVRVPVIVEDKDGEFVTGLHADDFRIIDGAPPALPVSDMISEDAPTSIGVLLDASDAARDLVPPMVQATLQLLAQFRPEDEVFLLQFGDEPTFLSDFAPGGEGLLSAVASYEPGGQRVLRDALATGLIRMREASHDKKSLVLVAAGEDDGSEVAPADVRRAAQREGVSIHVLLLPAGLPRWRPGQPADEATFSVQRLAHETGGLVALRPPFEERFGGLSGWIDTATADIGGYIKHQYLLQFESMNPPPPGEWRPLRVHVGNHPSGRIRARSGYVR